MNVVINGVGEQVGEGILNAAVGGIIKGQAPNKNGNVLIYSKNWQSSLVKDKRAAIYAGIKGDAQDIDDGKKVWNFVGINVNDAAYSLSKSGYGVRSMADIQKLDESKESRALNNSLKNEKLKLTAKELAVVFRDDPEGVKGYLTAKNDEKLINDTFREITGEEPTYYLHMPLNGWEKTEDTKGDIISCVTSDAKELLINKPKGPRDMIDVIDTGFKIGAVCFGAAELSLIMEGVERFGVKNTITMYSHGKLAENVEYNKSISAQNSAVGSASTEGITTKGAAESITKSEYSSLRKKTPSNEIRKMVNPEGPKVDPVYGYETNVLEADHIVPMKEIVNMPGFSQLSESQQIEILNLKDNFIGLGKSTNASKGAKSWSDWVGHSKLGEVPSDVRSNMLELESSARTALQKAIEERLKK